MFPLIPSTPQVSFPPVACFAFMLLKLWLSSKRIEKTGYSKVNPKGFFDQEEEEEEEEEITLSFVRVRITFPPQFWIRVRGMISRASETAL